MKNETEYLLRKYEAVIAEATAALPPDSYREAARELHEDNLSGSSTANDLLDDWTALLWKYVSFLIAKGVPEEDAEIIGHGIAGAFYLESH